MSLADNIEGLMAYVNADTLKYEFVNRAYEKSFGLPREKIIGSHIKDIVGESSFQYALQYLTEVKMGKSIAYENIFKLIKGDRWLQVNYTPAYDPNGNITSIVILSYDITERKLAEEKIKDQLNELKRFNSSMVDREIRMIQLKKEINVLCNKLNLPEKYSIPNLND
jgi:PAS domain S-box-containing protein